MELDLKVKEEIYDIVVDEFVPQFWPAKEFDEFKIYCEKANQLRLIHDAKMGKHYHSVKSNQSFFFELRLKFILELLKI